MKQTICTGITKSLEPSEEADFPRDGFEVRPVQVFFDSIVGVAIFHPAVARILR
jgi:hypothetical protein